MSWDNVKPPVNPQAVVSNSSVANPDGWGEHGWGAPPKQTIDLPIETVKADAARIGWGVAPVTNWGVHTNQTSPMTTSYEEWAEDESNYPQPISWADIQNDAPMSMVAAVENEKRAHELREAVWTANALDSANVKAGVVNALAGTKDAFNVDQDGELTRMNEIVQSTQKGPHGYYIAYTNGRWLHAILSGPYEFAHQAVDLYDRAYNMFINDPAFKLAFENNFDRAGIYCAEIPLSARRHGAYGVLS